MSQGYYERKRKPRPAPVEIEKQNWPQLIHELQRAGYSKPSITAATGLSREWIDSLLFKSSEPLWEQGEALIKFVASVREGANGNLRKSATEKNQCSKDNGANAVQLLLAL